MQHGLIVEDGVARNYDPPGRTLTGIWDINPSQQFVGTYIVGGVRHGFLQNSADHLRAQGKKVRPVIAADTPGVNQLEISLMGQGARLHAVPLELAQVLTGD
jgi:hypothetical protein